MKHLKQSRQLSNIRTTGTAVGLTLLAAACSTAPTPSASTRAASTADCPAQYNVKFLYSAWGFPGLGAGSAEANAGTTAVRQAAPANTPINVLPDLSEPDGGVSDTDLAGTDLLVYNMGGRGWSRLATCTTVLNFVNRGGRLMVIGDDASRVNDPAPAPDPNVAPNERAALEACIAQVTALQVIDYTPPNPPATWYHPGNGYDHTGQIVTFAPDGILANVAPGSVDYWGDIDTTLTTTAGGRTPQVFASTNDSGYADATGAPLSVPVVVGYDLPATATGAGGRAVTLILQAFDQGPGQPASTDAGRQVLSNVISGAAAWLFQCNTPPPPPPPCSPGNVGEACCATSATPCVSGLVCAADNTCEPPQPPPCSPGNVGEACCATSATPCVSGLVCGATNVCQYPCAGYNQFGPGGCCADQGVVDVGGLCCTPGQVNVGGVCQASVIGGAFVAAVTGIPGYVPGRGAPVTSQFVIDFVTDASSVPVRGVGSQGVTLPGVMPPFTLTVFNGRCTNVTPVLYHFNADGTTLNPTPLYPASASTVDTGAWSIGYADGSSIQVAGPVGHPGLWGVDPVARCN